jgi:hypothetical protein
MKSEAHFTADFCSAVEKNALLSLIHQLSSEFED